MMARPFGDPGRGRDKARDRGRDRGRSSGRARGGGRGRRSAGTLPAGPLQTYVLAPQPASRTPLAALPLLAVDLETTGLDPRRDRIISIGWVPVDGTVIRLGGAGQAVVSGEDLGEGGVGQSATVHGLTDDRLRDGVSLETAVGMLLEALAGRVVLAHHAAIEAGFLQAACRRLWDVRLDLTVVDTMRLHRRVVAPGFDDEPRGEDLRLWNARARFGLPVLRAHDALHDALAAAELYLAQIAELGLERADLRSVRS
ncbi:exonuclease domain-containing protein [Raineyella sp. LH-20]|uniref:exonuclease domain-containing protein n=1 Tax=Raineyella sp. LH-20 TaxID=3081204 RepID=UPI00295300F0|nr:exonuclease domain-containing protein [Raineyella sp. LH-20]WOP18633.1 exonuclease domain-containing protein [Raineyella sp. LH-20]